MFAVGEVGGNVHKNVGKREKKEGGGGGGGGGANRKIRWIEGK